MSQALSADPGYRLSLNDPRTSGLTRPRPRIVVNGAPIPGCKGFSITSSNSFTGDKFSADLAPPTTLNGPGGLAWWSDETKVQVDLQIGLVPPGAPESAAVWTSMLTGIVDQPTVDPIQGTVSIAGRDLTALLRDSGKGGYDVNQTSSEIVTALAQSVGLTPVVTATTGLVGRFFNIDYATPTLQSGHRVANKWDAIVELARLEGFDAFVSGESLYFQPPVDVTTTPWLVYVQRDAATGKVSSNVSNLQMSRALHIAKGIQVIVKSWHARQGLAQVATAGASGTNVQVYTIIRPGLTADQAKSLAQQYLLELSRHERTISGTAPGDMILTPRVMMQVLGTGTAFDQAYFPLSVTRHVDMGSGFSMDFIAKNQSPAALDAAGGAA